MSTPSDTTAPARAGRFSDGRSATGMPVAVRLGPRGIEIAGLGDHGPSDDAPLIWAYNTLATAAPLGTHDRDVLVTCAQQTGATLFVDDPTFATELADRAPHLTARAVRLKHAGPWLWAAAAVLLIAGVVWAMNLSPAHMVAHMLPENTRAALGSQVIRSMTTGRKVCETPAGRAAIDKLVDRLGATRQGRKPFNVTVVDWGLVNAFAAPGEQIVLTRGLIAKAGGPDEIAGVLAHEIGHGLELHPETGIVRALGMSAALELMTGGNSGTLANLGLMLAQFSYTRAAEREADVHALRLLRGAGISPQGIIDFFSRVEKSDSGGLGQYDVLRTHPQIAERKQLAQSQPPYATTSALADTDWQALRTICNAP
jgi:predicted Zn-dependent protease